MIDTNFTMFIGIYTLIYIQKQPSRSVLRKMCSENKVQIYRRASMVKWKFKKFDLQHY